jgi:hypothetical protein
MFVCAAIDLDGAEGEIVKLHKRLLGKWSGALLRCDRGKRGPALLDVLASAVGTGDLFLLMPSNGQSLQEGFLAVTAEEFIVGHTDLHSFEKGDGRILDPLVGRFNMGRSRILRGGGGGFIRRSRSRILRAVGKEKGAWGAPFGLE